MENRLTFGSLFAGIGGFDLAFEQAGATCLWQVEIDQKCRKVLEAHFPSVDRTVLDVKEAGKHNLKPVDLVCGGFPCKNLSTAGDRKGLKGEHSILWFEFYRIVEELKPTWIVIENVPGMLSSNSGRDFGIILHGLDKLRYHVIWRTLDAQYFGVPQRRKRVFIVGHLRDNNFTEIFFNSGISTRTFKTNKKSEQECTERTIPSPYIFDGRNMTTHSISIPLQSKKSGGYSLNYYPILYQNNRLRRLTPVECERLQGFPDGWTLSSKFDASRYRQLGNAVCVPVANWIARQIISFHRKQT